MKAHLAIGDFYCQEFSLQNAEDFAETLSLTAPVTVPAGSFHNCLKSKETMPLETDFLEYKLYTSRRKCPGGRRSYRKHGGTGADHT